MLDTLASWFSRSPRRLVQCGLWMVFAGGIALLLGALAGLEQAPALAERFPEVPTWFVPEHALGYTAAATLVCWGVWAMGAGLRLARGR
jgi:hypothetical protein